ncbi:hypothetical protein [Natrinema versiforme]|uniref:Uncharacterized protein n=1 Tax=Natrinema versiforme TaxID=88724 RepID=A0A4V1FYZ3_9EURY|nr:hypothetical protein [Natrinema versiforme]QCS41494.1 hypothetical protein FEJ81_03665 [Natrinema versiforme]
MTDGEVEAATSTADRSNSESDADPDSDDRSPMSPTGEAVSADENGQRDADDAGPSVTLPQPVARLRREPTLALPFAIAGVFLTVLDWLRRADPLPTLATGGGEWTRLSIEYAGYPTGVPETARSLEAFVGLRPPYLVWGIGLEILAFAAVAVAGIATVARASADIERWDEALSGRRLLAYFGVVVSFDAVGRVLGSFDGGLLLGAVLAVPLFAAFVRAFAAPAFVVAGAGPLTALSRSWRATRGIGLRVLALVGCLGLAAWFLGSLPSVGTVLSTTVVGAAHAVSTVTVRAESDETAGVSD